MHRLLGCSTWRATTGADSPHTYIVRAWWFSGLRCSSVTFERKIPAPHFFQFTNYSGHNANVLKYKSTIEVNLAMACGDRARWVAPPWPRFGCPLQFLFYLIQQCYILEKNQVVAMVEWARVLLSLALVRNPLLPNYFLFNPINQVQQRPLFESHFSIFSPIFISHLFRIWQVDPCLLDLKDGPI